MTTPDPTLRDQCAHCGQPLAGAATVQGQRVCHPSDPDRPDCYRLVTVYGETLGSRRPLRDQLAHAMAHAPHIVYQACNDDMYLRLADAGMPVIEAAIARQATGIDEEIIKRAEDAEQARDEWRILADQAEFNLLLTGEGVLDARIGHMLGLAPEARGREIIQAVQELRDRAGRAEERLAHRHSEWQRELDARIAAEQKLQDTEAVLAEQRQCAAKAERRHGEQKRRADEQWQRAEKAEAAVRRMRQLINLAPGRTADLGPLHLAATLDADQPKETPRRLTEQQGGIPNDAYTADDHPKGM